MDKSAQIECFGIYKEFYKQQGIFSSPKEKKKRVRTIQNYSSDGKLNGESRWFFQNGQIEYQENYQADQLHGVRLSLFISSSVEQLVGSLFHMQLSRAWYENGQLEYERQWKEGVLHGHNKEWYPDGSIKTHEKWRSGVREEVIIGDGKPVSRPRSFLLGNRFGAASNVGLGPSRGLDWLSLDGSSKSVPIWRG